MRAFGLAFVGGLAIVALVGLRGGFGAFAGFAREPEAGWIQPLDRADFPCGLFWD